jgi:hypothetical protein
MNIYGGQKVHYHNIEAGVIELAIVHDRMPGKHGYTGIIKDGDFEFVEDGDLTYGDHDAMTCERCQDN